MVNIIAPTTLKNSPITNTTIQVLSSSGDIITAIGFSGAGNSGFNCGILPALAPVICTGGSISTSGNLVVTASNGGFTGTSTQAYVIETDRPTAVISLSGSATNPTSQTVFSLRITTSEALSGSLSGLFSLVNAGISGMSVVDSTNTIFTITALSDGLVSVVLPDSVITDLAGNQNFVSNTWSRTVDTVPPTLPSTTASPSPSSGGLVTITTGLVESGATVSIPNMVCTPSPSTGGVVTCTGTGTNIGSNPTITITDLAGNFSTGTVTLIVDTIAPVITLVGPATLTIAQGGTYSESGATWTDNNDGTGTILVASGSVDTNTVGVYTLSYTYTDTASNSGNTVTRTVTVTDQGAPVITLV